MVDGEMKMKIAKVWVQGMTKSKCLVLPKEFCEKLGIKGGSYVEIYLKEDKIMIKKL